MGCSRLNNSGTATGWNGPIREMAGPKTVLGLCRPLFSLTLLLLFTTNRILFIVYLQRCLTSAHCIGRQLRYIICLVLDNCTVHSLLYDSFYCKVLVSCSWAVAQQIYVTWWRQYTTWQAVLTISGLQVGNDVRVEEISDIYELAGLCDSMLQTHRTNFPGNRIMTQLASCLIYS